ncbi:MAG: cation diffusion facilitator family transporter [Bacteroidales bacterium]|jgi:cation diffusion facilitator family transporter|nr:cation diffusion facilitator family transporter [Bacteroidales bacterium]MDD2204285.1 cation diffusion facilitator family transporter [Bacteroidales bacterium]MDD3151338.1 cation diffusion facilitator family transporter [Bacteroidales bacterium]MDD3913166.1 cation diffusion facilitator family transporter [Bacteroidales bacterium]MDD4633081.1 cation diffusion facilitator family transporter [Bacteroidales bacterium]
MNKDKASYLEGVISIILNIFLFALKFWAGIVTKSIALTADAWHTLSDSLSSLIVVLSVRFAAKKPDRQHPFGHGRIEQIAALFIAFMLAIIAYDFLTSAISQLTDHKSTTFGTLAIVVTITSIVLKEALAQYAFFVGKKYDNISIKADGWHHRSDAISSVVVLVGILFAKKFWWIDGVLGIIIALMLFYTTYIIIKEAITKLLGEEPSQELIDKITAIAKSIYDKDLQLHHFHIHNYVSQQELTFHIKLDGNLSIKIGHDIATKIENAIKEQLDITTTIHVEPLNFAHNLD